MASPSEKLKAGKPASRRAASGVVEKTYPADEATAELSPKDHARQRGIDDPLTPEELLELVRRKA